MNTIALECKSCDCKTQVTQEHHAEKYACPKCKVSVYRQTNGIWLMMKRTNGGRVFGLVAHSEIEIVSTDTSAADFPFRAV